MARAAARIADLVDDGASAAIVINMVVLWVTTLLSDRIEIDGFWSYLWASLIVSIVTMILHAVLPARSYQRAG